MIYTLVILACFGAGKTDCRTYEQPMTELAAHPAMQFVQAQNLMAQWLQKHPGVQHYEFRVEHGQGA